MARHKNRRFCTDLPDLQLPSPPREDKNTDDIDTFYTINYDEPPPMVSPGGESTAYLFNHVQDGNRRRYRAILSLVSTMTLIATAVAIISVTAKKMSSSKYNSDNIPIIDVNNSTEDGLGFEKYSLPPAMDDEGKEPLFPKPPIYAQIDVTAPPALTPNIERPTNTADSTPATTSPENDDDDNTAPTSGTLFPLFPPLSVVGAPSPWPTPSPQQQLDDDGLDYVFKRPSVLDLTRAPIPPTIHPTFQPTSSEPAIIAPTIAETQQPTNKPRPGEPTHEPFAHFDLVRPPALSTQIHPTTAPENVVILNDDYIGYLFDKYKNKDEDDEDGAVMDDDDDMDNIAVSEQDADADNDATVEDVARVTRVPSKQPVASTLMPTFSPTDKPTRPPRTKRPTKAPKTEITIIDEGVPMTEIVIIEEDESIPTSTPTSTPSETSTSELTSEATEVPTSEPTEEETSEETSETTQEPTVATTTKPTGTLRPRRTRRPTSAPVTMVPTSQAPVASTLAPVRVTMPPQHEITEEEEVDLPEEEASPSPTFKPTINPTFVPTERPVSSPPTVSPTESTETPTGSTERPTGSTEPPVPPPVEETPPPVEEETLPPVEEENDDATDETVVVMDDGTITYQPGDLTVEEAGLKLSTGLTARILATTGKPVVYADGTESEKVFHGRPDAGQTFPDTRPENPGGWVYVSFFVGCMCSCCCLCCDIRSCF